MTKETWSKVYEMNVYEFFNILAFSRDYNKNLLAKSRNTMTY